MPRISDLLNEEVDFRNPELVAERTLECADAAHEYPVDLQKVLSLWPGLQVTCTDITNSGYLMALSKENGQIVLRQQDRLVRRRFSLAHELGHWVTGDNHGTSHDVTIGGIPTEIWCDRFANRLLTPKFAVDKYFGDTQEMHTIAMLIARFAFEFQVSRDTTFIRLRQHNNLSILLFADRNRFVRVFTNSNNQHEQLVRNLYSHLRSNPSRIGKVYNVEGMQLVSVLFTNPAVRRKELVVVGFPSARQPR